MASTRHASTGGLHTAGLTSTLRRFLPDGRTMADREFAVRQRWMTAVLGAHVPFLVAVGLARSQGVLHLFAEVVLPLGFLTWLSAWARFSPVVRAILTTTGLVASSSILVHLTDGLIESHFHFFVLVPLVTLYQHWTPFGVMIAWVLFHHGVVGVLDPDAVYNHPAAINSPVVWALVHAAFVGAASVASVVSWRLNEDERRRTELLLVASAQPIYGRDRDGRITMASRSLAALLGARPRDLVGQRDHDLLHAGPVEGCEICDAVVGERAEELADPFFELGDRRIPVEISSRRLGAGAGHGSVVVSFTDISTRRAHEEELRHRAHYDDLTGLANRSLVSERLGDALAGLASADHDLAVLVVDLDGFKVVNDSLGHEAGDVVLRTVGDRLAAAAPQATVGRLGADEFVVVLAEVSDADQVGRVAERILAELGVPVDFGDHQFTVAASVGTKVTRDDRLTAADLLRDAEAALAVSKRHRRGRTTEFDDAMRTDAQRRLHLTSALRRAVRTRSLAVAYQPRVDIHRGEIVGVEALCRWTDDELGPISPQEFIPLAEECGLIGDVGAFVLEEATSQLDRWVGELEDRRLGMAVNVSGVQIRDAGFFDGVEAALTERSFAPDQLTLEVTESTLVEGGTASFGRIDALRRLGVRISVDDFGTGYSSLATLRTLPTDELKVDRILVHGIADDVQNQEMVRVVLAMADVLGLNIVAEGAETDADVETLRRLGCRFVQGYATGRPMDAAAVHELISRQRARLTVTAVG
jgi:diguanylate cyclase (GGDEF)-like protein